jgi:Outer membrane protein beta-barrel domain
MKKIFFVLLTVIAVQVAFAQKGKAKVGITAGIAWSNLYDNVDGNEKTDARTGASVGLVLDAPINPCWTFQPAVQYIQKGANIIKSKDETKYIALRYAELQLNFLKTTRSGIYAGIGPVLSFAMPSKTVTENSDGTSEKPLTFGNEPINNYRGLDYGANAVIGVKCKSGILVGLNYTLGLRNLTPAGAEPKQKTGSIGFKVGYLFK